MGTWLEEQGLWASWAREHQGTFQCHCTWRVESTAWVVAEEEVAVAASGGVLYSIRHHLHLLILVLSVSISIVSERDQTV